MTTLGVTLRSTISALTLFAAAAFTTPAAAQLERLALSGIERDALQPYYARADLAKFTDVLELTDDQKTIVDSVFADYEAAMGSGASGVRAQLKELEPLRRANDDVHREVRDRLRERSRTMRDELKKKIEGAADSEARRQLLDDFQTQVRELQNELRAAGRGDAANNPEVTQRTAEILQAWGAQKHQIRGMLEANTQAVLDAEQRPRWAELDRTLRRQKTIGRGQLSGESVDLTRLVDDLELDETVASSLDKELDAYAVDLDGALRARNDRTAALRDRPIRLMREGTFELGQAIGRDRIELHVAVRDVNHNYAQRLIAALPEEPATRLREAYDVRAFPRVFRATRGTRAFDAVKQIEGVDAEATETIGKLETAYLQQLASMNERLRDVIRQHEPAAHKRRLDRLTAERGSERVGPADDPIRTLYDTRREFDEQYIANIEGLLTEEQIAQMPRSATRP